MRRVKSLNGMEIAVFIVFCLGLFAWFAIEKDSQNPEGDIAWTTERDLRTGEIFNVETVRCHICKQVISCLRIDAGGKAIGGFGRSTHNCNRLLAKNKYTGLGLGPKKFNLFDWLARWQKKLSRISQ